MLLIRNSKQIVRSFCFPSQTPPDGIFSLTSKIPEDNVASNWQNMVDERLLDWYESGTSLEHAVSTLTHADVRDDLRARALENTWSHSDREYFCSIHSVKVHFAPADSNWRA